MGVVVLNPQNCLKDPSSSQPLIFSPPNMKVLQSPSKSKPKSNRSHRNQPNRPKRTSVRPHNGTNSTRPTSPTSLKPPVNKIVMGQVKILQRGKQLTDTAADRASDPIRKGGRVEADLGSMKCLGPNPELVPTERVAGLYAGSSMFVASPPPSSVPLPAFFTKKTVSDATSDLRRILRLDLP